MRGRSLFDRRSVTVLVNTSIFRLKKNFNILSSVKLSKIKKIRETNLNIFFSYQKRALRLTSNKVISISNKAIKLHTLVLEYTACTDSE